MIRNLFALAAAWLASTWTFGTLYTLTEDPFHLPVLSSILAGGVATLPGLLVAIQISGNQAFGRAAIASSGAILLLLTSLQPGAPHPAGALAFLAAGIFISRRPGEIRALGIHQLRPKRKPTIHFQDPGKPHLN